MAKQHSTREDRQKEREFHSLVLAIFDEMKPEAERIFRAISNDSTRTDSTIDCILQIENIGTSSGRAGPAKGQHKLCRCITINSQLADHPVEELRSTLAHEWAHVVIMLTIVTWKMPFDDYDWSNHGPYWRMVDESLGGNGDRGHNLNLTPLRVHKRKHVYLCDNGDWHYMTTNMHNRIQKGKQMRLCRDGGLILHDSYLGEGVES
jgi:predicted SprT family Zn-dependent metalloprotease